MDTLFIQYPELQEDLSKVREVMLDNLRQSGPGIREALTDLVRANGKMLRPAFLVLCSRLGNFDPDKFYRLGAAVEMLHMATLIHDDIIDNAELRRGHPAAHTLYGTKQAVLMGDFLFSRCFLLAANNAAIENGKLMSKAVAAICESEIRQAQTLYDPYVSVREYLRRITGKTAALFILSFHTGISESGLGLSAAAAGRKAGYNLGVAFQIIDDILDYTSAAEELGKPAGSDLKQGVFTLPLILSLQKDNGSLRNLLDCTPYSGETIQEALKLVDLHKGVVMAKKIAQTYTNRALESIGSLPKGSTKSTLLDLTERMLSRNY